MSKRRRFKDAKEKRDGSTFVPLPHAVLESTACKTLPARAKALLMDMLAQFRGNNNGDICAAFSVMRQHGWRSEQTLFAARKDLEEAGLICETRKGARPNRASLYGFTFYALDESPKLEITARAFPRGLWRKKELIPTPVRRGAVLTTQTVVETPLIAPINGVSTPAATTPFSAIDASN